MKRGKWVAAVVTAVTTAMAMTPGVAMASTKVGLSKKAANHYTIAFVPKLIGIPYFTAMEQGMKAASKKLGGKFIYEGPTTATVEGQDEYVKTLIAQHVSAIGISANAASSVCPLYSQAIKAKLVVYASDSDVSCANNELWVEQATSKAIGYEAMDLLARELHDHGQFAIVSGGSTATNLNQWISYMKERLKLYPGMKLVSVQYAGEDVSQAETVASRLIAAYPNIKGFIGVASTDAPGIAEAVDEAGMKGKIAITGLMDPNTVRPDYQNGTIKRGEMWNPVNLGYLTYWGVLQLLEHHSLKAENTVPGLPGKYAYDAATRTLLLGPPLVITDSNIHLNF